MELIAHNNENHRYCPPFFVFSVFFKDRKLLLIMLTPNYLIILKLNHQKIKMLVIEFAAAMFKLPMHIAEHFHDCVEPGLMWNS